MNLFLDDVRQPKDAFLTDEMSWLRDYTKIPDENWVVVRNYDDFVKVIQERGIPSTVAFDCDLHKEHMRHYVKDAMITGVYEWENFKVKCGIHCAEYLKDLVKTNKSVKIVVHSANECGRKIIKEIFKDNLL